MQIYLTREIPSIYRMAAHAEMSLDNENWRKGRHGGPTLTFNGYGGSVHSARRPNTRNQYVRETDYAATWDQWGVLLSQVFAADPEARVGGYLRPVYNGAADFHRQTDGRFVGVVWLGDLLDFHGDHTFRFDPSLGGFTTHVSKCTKCSARIVRG